MKTKNIIRSLDDLSFVSQRAPKILALFSGALDSSFILKKLSHRTASEVICLTVDLGDGVNRDDLDALAKHFGARAIVGNGRERFAHGAVLPAIRANAMFTQHPSAQQ